MYKNRYRSLFLTILFLAIINPLKATLRSLTRGVGQISLVTRTTKRDLKSFARKLSSEHKIQKDNTDQPKNLKDFREIFRTINDSKEIYNFFELKCEPCRNRRNFAERLPGIAQISLLNLESSDVSDAIVQLTLFTAKRLKELRIEGCSRLWEPFVYHENLERLFLGGGQNVTDVMLENIGRKLPHLTELHLINCKNVIKPFIEGEHLKILNLSQCSRITDEAVHKACAHCPKLEHLHLTGTSITQETINILQTIYPELEIITNLH